MNRFVDPKVECSPYSYPLLSAQRTSFPESWKVAKILPGDTAAQDRWNSIVPNVPNIPPKVPCTIPTIYHTQIKIYHT